MNHWLSRVRGANSFSHDMLQLLGGLVNIVMGQNA